MLGTISLRAYARHRGTDLKTVQVAAEGRIARAIKRNEAGRITGVDPELADRLWSENTDPAQSERRAGKTASGEKKPRKRRETAAKGDDYYTFRSARERAQSELMLLELEQKRGNLVDAQGVAEQFANVMRDARDSFIATFDRLEALAALDPRNAQLRTAIRRERNETLAKFAAYCENEADRAEKPARSRVRRSGEMVRAGSGSVRQRMG